MGTHPIFESDFDCLTEEKFLLGEILILESVQIESGWFEWD